MLSFMQWHLFVKLRCHARNSSYVQVLNGTDLIAEGKIKATALEASVKAEAESSGEQPEMWPCAGEETVDADAFYRDVSRTGITYGPCFRMVQKASADGSQCLMRYNSKFIVSLVHPC